MNCKNVIMSTGILAVIAWSAALGAIRNAQTGTTYTQIQAAVNAASSGDTIEIDAGTYTQPDNVLSTSPIFATIGKNLTIRGVGTGRAVLDANGFCPNSQGIFIANRADITIENIDFRNCHSGNNACGIRMSDPGNLMIRNCIFYNDDDGIMGGNNGVANITVEYCEFNYCGWGAVGLTHNIYAGACNSFTMRYSYSHSANVGHEVKTRAQKNYIFYNRITDEPGSTSSYEIDVPQGGTTYIVGNMVEQSAASQNSTIMTYGEECSGPVFAGSVTWNSDQHLYVVNNTVVNDRGGGTFLINNSPTINALVMNNIFQGSGTTIKGLATASNNWATSNAYLANAAGFDYHLTASSTGAIDLGSIPSPSTGIDGTSLIPVYQYVHPCSYEARPVAGLIDIGAYEYSPNQPPTVSVTGSPSFAYEGWPISLHANASDPNNDPLTYAWTQTAGQNAALAGAAMADLSFAAPSLSSQGQSLLTLKVTVTDGRGGSANSTASVQVYLMGDVDHDYNVNLADLKLVVAAWNAAPASGNWNPPADLDGDLAVNLSDLKLLVANWNRTVGP